MFVDYNLKPEYLKGKHDRFWDLSGEKILKIETEYGQFSGAPVFTVNGKYTARGWTEWTQGFQYGSAILQQDATSDETFLKIGRENMVNIIYLIIGYIKGLERIKSEYKADEIIAP